MLPLFLGVPCVLYLRGHQCITLYCTWHLAVSLPEIRAHLATAETRDQAGLGWTWVLLTAEGGPGDEEGGIPEFPNLV